MKVSAMLLIAICLLYVYPYIIYPLILRLLCSLRPRTLREKASTSARISHIICAHNEERFIEKKLINTLESQEDRQQEIVLVCDGCVDRTAEISQRFAENHPELRVLSIPHSGKTAAQNLAAKSATGDIFVLSDVDTLLQPETIDLLTRSLKRKVVCVGANVQYELEDSPDGFYIGREAQIKTLEGCLAVLMGVQGGCYAVRKEAFVELDPSVLSDLALPLEVLLGGGQVTFEPSARAYKASKYPTLKTSMRRRRRIFCRAMITMFRKGYFRRILRRPDLLFYFVSDKLLRYLIGPLTGTILLLAAIHGGRIPNLFIGLILVSLGVALVVACTAEEPRLKRLKAASVFFITVNVASILALVDFVARKDYTKW
jgi:cellulose synthase/poly-beta-1,6-N-acetylglucosamine synthase-like glycosyltransferase